MRRTFFLHELSVATVIYDEQVRPVWTVIIVDEIGDLSVQLVLR